jgi:CheY-like chemotaxis protein
MMLTPPPTTHHTPYTDHTDYCCCCRCVQMPLMTGPEVALKLREMKITVPIIGLTGNAAAEDVEYFRNCGANSIVSKPFSLEQLYGAISHMS